MDTATYYQVVVAVLTGLIGLCVGSFLNVVIYRLPNEMSLSTPPSHCPQCNYTLHWYDNIPVLSYLFLGGRCRQCRGRISPRYLFVELGNAVLWLICLWRFGTDGWRGPVTAAAAALACSVCLCVALIDWEHQIIFDRFQILLGVLAVAFTVADTTTTVWSHIGGGIGAGAVFWILAVWISRRVGQEALGGGDIKFGFVAGLFLGWEKLILMMLIASLSACIVLGTKGRTTNADGKRQEYPFGPFLTAGFTVAMLWGTPILNAYLHLLGLE